VSVPVGENHQIPARTGEEPPPRARTLERFTIAWVRYRFLHVSLHKLLLMVTCGGAIVVAISSS